MLLTSVLAFNYGRVESRYPTVDLLQITTRRALNLTEDWLLSVVSEDDWNDNYKDILTADFGDDERLAEQREKWGDPDEDGRGSFVLERKEQPATSNMNFKPANPAP